MHQSSNPWPAYHFPREKIQPAWNTKPLSTYGVINIKMEYIILHNIHKLPKYRPGNLRVFVSWNQLHNTGSSTPMYGWTCHQTLAPKFHCKERAGEEIGSNIIILLHTPSILKRISIYFVQMSNNVKLAEFIEKTSTTIILHGLSNGHWSI
jgi:hypothetical protein